MRYAWLYLSHSLSYVVNLLLTSAVTPRASLPRKTNWAGKQKRKKYRVPGFKDRCHPTPTAASTPAWKQQTLAYYALPRKRRQGAHFVGRPAQSNKAVSAGSRGEELSSARDIFRAHKSEVVGGGSSNLLGFCVASETGGVGASNLSGKQTFFLPISKRDGKHNCLSVLGVQCMGDRAGHEKKRASWPLATPYWHPLLRPTKTFSALGNPCPCKQYDPMEATQLTSEIS